MKLTIKRDDWNTILVKSSKSNRWRRPATYYSLDRIVYRFESIEVSDRKFLGSVRLIGESDNDTTNPVLNFRIPNVGEADVCLAGLHRYGFKNKKILFVKFNKRSQ